MQGVDSEVLTRCLFNESNDGFIIFEPGSGRILEVNPTTQRLTGWRRKKLLELKLSDLLHGNEPAMSQLLEIACHDTTFFHGKDGYLLKHSEGHEVDVNLSVSRLHGAGGTLGLIVVRDVTERKRGDELRSAYQQVLEKLATGSSLQDILTTVTEIAENQVPGMACSVLLLDDDGLHLRVGVAPQLPEAYRREVDGLKIGPGQGSCGTAAYEGRRVIVEDILVDPLAEGCCRKLADRYLWRACWSQPILSTASKVLGTFTMYFRQVRRPSPQEIRLIETAAHIAGIAIERQARESELLRQQAHLGLVTRLTTVGELAAGIVHEVTQPASAVVNFAAACEAIVHQEPGGPHDQLLTYLGEIQLAARRIGKIADRLRTFVKGAEPHRSTCHIHQLIHEVLGLVTAEVHRRHVAVELDLGDRDGVMFADRVQMQQVLVNLIVNACDAIDEAGSSRRTIRIRCHVSGSHVELCIEDSGTGIPPADVERVFEPFFTTKLEGTGIGLSICRTIVETHGGQINARNLPHGGAVFHVLLPSHPHARA